MVESEVLGASRSIDASRCPLCGESNACGMAAGQESCWCFDVSIPAAVLEKIPEEARGVACVCEACARDRDRPGRRELTVAGGSSRR